MTLKEEVAKKLAEMWEASLDDRIYRGEVNEVRGVGFPASDKWVAEQADDIIALVRNSMKDSMKRRKVTDAEILKLYYDIISHPQTQPEKAVLGAVRWAIAESIGPIQEQEPTQNDKRMAFIEAHAEWLSMVYGPPAWVVGDIETDKSFRENLDDAIAAEEAAAQSEIEKTEAEIAALQAKLAKLKGGV